MLVNSVIAVAIAVATAVKADTVPSTSGLPAAQTIFENQNYAKYLSCIESSTKALHALSDECKKTDKEALGDTISSVSAWPACSCDAHNLFPKCIEDAGVCAEGIKAYRGLFPGTCRVDETSAVVPTGAGYSTKTEGKNVVYSGVGSLKVGVLGAALGAFAGLVV
ncbi:hypothetical protein HDU97_004958 [Phlyctochytrium planicorne]|nr:hypothetical protein HDU97_004958 [Phlyctochytrium planicorne]